MSSPLLLFDSLWSRRGGRGVEVVSDALISHVKRKRGFGARALPCLIQQLWRIGIIKPIRAKRTMKTRRISRVREINGWRWFGDGIRWLRDGPTLVWRWCGGGSDVFQRRYRDSSIGQILCTGIWIGFLQNSISNLKRSRIPLFFSYWRNSINTLCLCYEI